MTPERYEEIKQAWKSGYKLKKIAETLKIPERDALEQFTEVVNIELGLVKAD